MDFSSYVERQKQHIRDRHSGEETLIVCGRAVSLKEGEGRFARMSCTRESASGAVADAMTIGDFEKLSRQLFAEIAAMKGLNLQERAAFC